MDHDIEINRACIIVLLIFAVSLCLHAAGYSETIIGDNSAYTFVAKGSHTITKAPATSNSLATYKNSHTTNNPR